MRIRKPGRVNERIWFLGREESGVYLLDGNNGSMIVSGGISYIVADLLQQFKEFGIDENRIQKLLILHSHFDHVGIVPFSNADTQAWKSMPRKEVGRSFGWTRPS